MRAALVLAVVGLGLTACGGGSDRTVVVPQPQTATTVIVPQGATVICPNGRSAVLSDGAYRC
ncbi:MAG TPA: hypothetical protein VN766_11465 [Stellaceae bacterium]|nr:hypothetical protein [Stellaceae bacterium]